MTYEEWGEVVQFARTLDSMAARQVVQLYADWTADRKSRAKQMAEDVSAVLDEALNMGDGTYKP